MRNISCVITVKSIVFFLAALLFFASGAWARPTTEDEARNVAVNWLSLESKPMGSPMGHEVKKVETFTDETGEPTYYVVHLLPSGLIFLPADDQVEPIIGFVSDATSYDPSPTNPLGALVSRDIPGRIAYAREKRAALQSGETFAADSLMAKAQIKWASLSGPLGPSENTAPTSTAHSEYLASISHVLVLPLVQTQWSQQCAGGGPEPCKSKDPDAYNYYTPPNAAGNIHNYPCGCLATAMAQVMRRFDWPTAGIGRLSLPYSFDTAYPGDPPQLAGRILGGDDLGGPYHFANMPSKTSPTTPLDQLWDIGRLTWDAGLAVNSDYKSTINGGTGAYMSNVPHALKKTFHYSNAICGGFDGGPALPQADLFKMINPNLNAEYPVILRIVDDPGVHAVVCDGYGYNGATMYHHLNMGWFGQDDFWYNLEIPMIDTPHNGTFNKIESCVYNIYTHGTGEIIAGRVTDKANNPLPDVLITAVPVDGGKPLAPAITGVTQGNDKGIYALVHALPDTSYKVKANMPDSTVACLQVSTGVSTDNTTATGNLWQVDFPGITATADTTPQNLTVGKAMAPFSPFSKVCGGTQRYTFTSGTLPAGLSLNAKTGFVSGTPTAAYATANVVFSVKDANGIGACTTSTVSFTVKTPSPDKLVYIYTGAPFSSCANGGGGAAVGQRITASIILDIVNTDRVCPPWCDPGNTCYTLDPASYLELQGLGVRFVLTELAGGSTPIIYYYPDGKLSTFELYTAWGAIYLALAEDGTVIDWYIAPFGCDGAGDGPDIATDKPTDFNAGWPFELCMDEYFQDPHTTDWEPRGCWAAGRGTWAGPAQRP
jgi:hypothetical protein